MKMLLIVFRQSMVGRIHALLKEYDVNAFTELHNVAGRGETGPNVQFFLSPGANCVIFTVVPESLASRLIDGFTRFKVEQGMEPHNNVHVFVLPCEQAV